MENKHVNKTKQNYQQQQKHEISIKTSNPTFIIGSLNLKHISWSHKIEL